MGIVNKKDLETVTISLEKYDNMVKSLRTYSSMEREKNEIIHHLNCTLWSANYDVKSLTFFRDNAIGEYQHGFGKGVELKSDTSVNKLLEIVKKEYIKKHKLEEWQVG